MTTNPHAPSFAARCLGFGGLIPFAGLAAALWLIRPAIQPLVAMALLGYGATICSFLGGIHWGLAMRDGPAVRASSLIWGVVPSLLAWVALMLPPAAGLLLIAATLCACFAVDRVAYPRDGLQAWLPLRLQLTVVAGLGCLAGAAAPGLS